MWTLTAAVGRHEARRIVRVVGDPLLVSLHIYKPVCLPRVVAAVAPSPAQHADQDHLRHSGLQCQQCHFSLFDRTSLRLVSSVPQ